MRYYALEFNGETLGLFRTCEKRNQISRTPLTAGRRCRCGEVRPRCQCSSAIRDAKAAWTVAGTRIGGAERVSALRALRLVSSLFKVAEGNSGAVHDFCESRRACESLPDGWSPWQPTVPAGPSAADLVQKLPAHRGPHRGATIIPTKATIASPPRHHRCVDLLAMITSSYSGRMAGSMSPAGGGFDVNACPWACPSVDTFPLNSR